MKQFMSARSDCKKADGSNNISPLRKCKGWQITSEHQKNIFSDCIDKKTGDHKGFSRQK